MIVKKLNLSVSFCFDLRISRLAPVYLLISLRMVNQLQYDFRNQIVTYAFYMDCFYLAP